jgi:ribosomal protein S18 acetylase RimI-like enzyme
VRADGTSHQERQASGSSCWPPSSASEATTAPGRTPGNITGFVVLSDRDEDDSYEAVSHIWTASRWRRRGIAQRLLTEAKSRFEFTEIEQPYSTDGDAFPKACGYVK